MVDSIYWIWFQEIFGVGTRRAEEILSHIIEPVSLYELSREHLEEMTILTPAEIDKILNTTLDNAKRHQERADELGYEVLTPYDVRYPDSLRNIYSKPLTLYAKGDISVLDDANLMIAMVGTRNFTEYGKIVADEISADLVKCGAIVVSGLAMGIDTISHAGAIKAGGKTIAVMGCGIDVDYPKQNFELKEMIAKNGVVLSEYPPETQPLPHNFPIRNRIISGLSRGVVVVEADIKSGSLITAGHALAQDRDVFAVPGRITDMTSRGANKLILQGAKPVTNVNDILGEYTYGEYDISLKVINLQQLKKKYRHILQDKADKPVKLVKSVELDGTDTGKKLAPEYLNNTQLMIYTLLDSEPKHTDYIAQTLGLRISQVLAALTELEIYGLIKAYPGRMFSA